MKAASNAMTPGHQWPGSLQRSLAMLRASIPHRTVLMVCMAAVVLLLAFAAVAIAHARQPGQAANTVLTLVSLAVAAPWGLWFSRLLLLRMEAHAWRMPALPAAIPIAISHLLLATVALPAVLLVLAGVEPVLAVSCLLLAAMAALLFAMLPRWCYLAACFAPLGLVLLGALATRIWGPGVLELDFTTMFAPWQVPWLAALATLIAAWRWRAIVRADALPTSPWALPTVLTPQGNTSWGNAAAIDTNQWQAQMPDWLTPARQTGRAGPGLPLRAMRVVLGTPFAPLTPAQLAVQMGVVLLCLLVLALLSIGDVDHERTGSLISGGLSGALGGGGIVLATLYGWRLEVLRRRPAGEMTELALLPGWGNSSRARRTLLSAVARPLLLAAGLATAILAPISVVAGIDAAGMAWLLAAVVGLCLLAALSCLRPLSGKTMVSPWMLVLMGLVMVMVVATAIAIRPGESTPFAWLAGGWGLLYLACGLGLATSWRRFRTRPHPFLQE